VFRGNFVWKLILYPLLILGFVGVLSGRAVCGWACPIGLLQRGTGSVARKMKKYSVIQKLGSHKIEPYLRYIKYVNLVGLVIITPIVIGFMFTDICPVGFLTGTLPILILNPGKFIPSFYFYPALAILILFLVLIFMVERGWCRYFCPVGALLAPFNKISYLHVAVHPIIGYPDITKKCINCDACSNSCPMGIDVPNMNRDPECILCGKCIHACPQKLISFERGK
jgi:polyferredoxin